MRDTGLADRLRARGLKVVEVDGWRTRGKDSFAPRGSVNHHTAGPGRGNAPSLGVCINGRSDLPGPLCHVLLARDLTCYVIAAGRANHAGLGGWRGLAGNSSVHGLECENVGTAAEPWTAGQIDAMAKIHAAFLTAPGSSGDPSLSCQHREWAPRRKPDAHHIDGDVLRRLIGAELKAGAPKPPPPTDPEGEDMAEILKAIEETKPIAVRVKDPGGQPPSGHAGEVWILTGSSRWHVPDRDTLALLYFLALIRADADQEPGSVLWSQIDGIPAVG